MHAKAFIFIYVRMYVYMHVCMYTCMYVYMYVCMYVCAPALIVEHAMRFLVPHTISTVVGVGFEVRLGVELSELFREWRCRI